MKVVKNTTIFVYLVFPCQAYGRCSINTCYIKEGINITYFRHQILNPRDYQQHELIDKFLLLLKHFTSLSRDNLRSYYVSGTVPSSEGTEIY